MYDFYVDDLLLPITPKELKIDTPNLNKTFKLVNGGEINIIKEPGLKQVSFTCLLPATFYPFANYKRGFTSPIHYLEKLDFLKANKKPFQLIIHRRDSLQLSLFDTNMTVTLEDFKVKESAEDGNDITVELSFKEYSLKNTKKVVAPLKNIEETQHSEGGQRYIDKMSVVNEEFKSKAFIRKTRPITLPFRNGKTDINVDTNIWRVARKRWGDLKNLPNLMKQNDIKTYLQEVPKVIHYAELEY